MACMRTTAVDGITVLEDIQDGRSTTTRGTTLSALCISRPRYGVVTMVELPSVGAGGAVPAVGFAGFTCTATESVDGRCFVSFVSTLAMCTRGSGRRGYGYGCGCDTVLGHRCVPRRLGILCCSRILGCSSSLSFSAGWLRDRTELDGLFLHLRCDGRSSVCLRLCDSCCCLLLCCFFVVLVVAKDGFLVFLCCLFGLKASRSRVVVGCMTG